MNEKDNQQFDLVVIEDNYGGSIRIPIAGLQDFISKLQKMADAIEASMAAAIPVVMPFKPVCMDEIDEAITLAIVDDEERPLARRDKLRECFKRDVKRPGSNQKQVAKLKKVHSRQRRGRR